MSPSSVPNYLRLFLSHNAYVTMSALLIQFNSIADSVNGYWFVLTRKGSRLDYFRSQIAKQKDVLIHYEFITSMNHLFEISADHQRQLAEALNPWGLIHFTTNRKVLTKSYKLRGIKTIGDYLGYMVHLKIITPQEIQSTLGSLGTEFLKNDDFNQISDTLLTLIKPESSS